jgi:hypothetical protein
MLDILGHVRAMPSVDRDCLVQATEPMSESQQPQPQFLVFEAPERLVEKTDRFQYRPADHHGVHRHDIRSGQCECELARSEPVQVAAAADVRNEAPIRHQVVGIGMNHRLVRVLFEKRDLDFEFVRIPQVVRIQERDERRIGRADAIVPRGGQSMIRRLHVDDSFVVQPGNVHFQFGGAISPRTVVYEQHLPVLEPLGEHTLDGRFRELKRGVVEGDDHIDACHRFLS